MLVITLCIWTIECAFVSLFLCCNLANTQGLMYCMLTPNLINVRIIYKQKLVHASMLVWPIYSMLFKMVYEWARQTDLSGGGRGGSIIWALSSRRGNYLFYTSPMHIKTLTTIKHCKTYMGYAGKHWGSNYKHWQTLGQHWGNIGMKELGHCAGITTLASTAWVTRARARAG